MKFLPQKIFFLIKKPNFFLQPNKTKGTFCENTLLFTNFFLKKGFSKKVKVTFYKIFSKINLFFYKNQEYISKNYSHTVWILENFFFKKLNYQNLFSPLVDLIKSPFLIKSILISKKIKKKTKIRYAIKIVYKNENKRLRNSLKQLYYYSNKFVDNKFEIRLYKAILFSLLEWKHSHLFKLKTLVFRKFFKF